MLSLFKKKKKEASKRNDFADLPEPPAPVGEFREEPSSRIPDDHPLDQPFEHSKKDSTPSTNLADDPELDEIRKAVDRVGRASPPTLETASEHKEQDQDDTLAQRYQHMEDEALLALDAESFEQEEQSSKPPEPQPPQFTPSSSLKKQAPSEAEPQEPEELPHFDERPTLKPSPGKPYTLHSLPDVEDIPPLPSGTGIYVDLRDYEAIFKEIKYVNEFSHRCFRTVLKLTDLSGNQNNLLEKFHDDLAYVNERLTYMDMTFFEQKR